MGTWEGLLLDRELVTPRAGIIAHGSLNIMVVDSRREMESTLAWNDRPLKGHCSIAYSCLLHGIVSIAAGERHPELSALQVRSMHVHLHSRTPPPFALHFSVTRHWHLSWAFPSPPRLPKILLIDLTSLIPQPRAGLWIPLPRAVLRGNQGHQSLIGQPWFCIAQLVRDRLPLESARIATARACPDRRLAHLTGRPIGDYLYGLRRDVAPTFSLDRACPGQTTR